MKRYLILIIAALVFVMHSYAQYSHSSSASGMSATKVLSGSNEFLKSTMIINDKSRNMATSYIRVMRSFTFHFERATNQSWYKYKKNFMVHFTVDERKTSAVFNRKGTLLYSLSNCSEKDLSTESQTFINTAYNNHEIVCVTKAYYRGENRLVVLLEDEKSFVYLWWKNGEMQESIECQKVNSPLMFK